MFKVPERFRITAGYHPTNENDGNNGAFMVPLKSGKLCQVIPMPPWIMVGIKSLGELA